MTFRVRKSVFVLSFLLAACGSENNFTENPESKNNNLVLDDLILDDPKQEVITTQEMVATEPDQEATVAAQAVEPAAEVVAPDDAASPVVDDSPVVPAVTTTAIDNTANEGRVVFDKRDPAVDAENYVGTVTVKFIEEAKVQLRRGQLSVAQNREEVSEIADYLSTHGLSIKRTFRGKSYAEYDQQRAELEARSGQKLIDLNSFYEVTVEDAGDAEDLIAYLNQFEVVEVAHAEYTMSPIGKTDKKYDYEPDQNYLNPLDKVVLPAGQWGVDAEYAWNVAGGTATGISIVTFDIGWIDNHLDLPTIAVESGTSSTKPLDMAHGTAVLGILGALKDGYGVTGIAHNATLKVARAPDDNTAKAGPIILELKDKLNSGDVLLIEVGNDAAPSGSNCTKGCIPLEGNPATFAAIQNTVSKGIIVVDGAGNGGLDLDGKDFDGINWPDFSKDSGAIMVGASSSVSLCPTSFSNYGSRLNLQGYGWNVWTTAYWGDQDPTGDENNTYTKGFSGTSSASAIVAGTVASLSGVAKAHGVKLTPQQLRDILVTTGEPQGVEPGPFKNIGPLPNLKNAIAKVLDMDGDGVKLWVPADDPPSGPSLGPSDNCPDVANPDQKDSNNNGIGDTCEPIAPAECKAGEVKIDGSCQTCVENESIITLTSYNDYYVLTHKVMGKQYQIKTTKVAKDAADTNAVVINGKEFSIPMKNKVMVGADFPTIQIEVTEIWPAPVDHLRLAVRSVCSSP